MNASRSVAWIAMLGALSWMGASQAQLLSDDNGEESFVRQAIPKILGRKPRGALEVKLLLDVDNQVGRAAVVRSLMRTDEYVDHWTDVIVDMLRVQRIGDRAQDPACFGAAHQSTSPVTTSLALFVRDQPPDTATAPPGGAFNMVDLVRSSIALDDLSPVYRAYPVPLTWKFNPMVGEVSVGDAFNHTVLNREPDCTGCHNSALSTSGNANSAFDMNNPNIWVRTWPAPFHAEQSVYGANYPVAQATRDAMYPVFRLDQFFDSSTNPPTTWPAVRSPWGMVPECGQLLFSIASLPSRATQFANLSGNQIGLLNLAASFKSGSDTLKASGLHLSGMPNALPVAPGDQALAYMTAEKVVDGVWKELLGSPLTIANYFPRNKAERDALLQLTDKVFITEQWSLRALIADIMAATAGPEAGYFNRKEPSIDPNTPAYRLPLLFDPWVQKDPRLADPMPDPAEHYNGQGELVHRYSIDSLLHSVAAALGWPEPQRFPPAAGTGYPDMQLEESLGQFISDDYQGRDGVDFQGLLSWESTVGVCDKTGAGVTGGDWIDRLAAAVTAYNTANPTAPLTVADLEIIMKDWLTGDAWIGTTAPTPLDPLYTPVSEADALAALFAAQLTDSSATVPDLTAKLRRACGALVESPQFMLAGIRPIGPNVAPKLRVCNPSTPCTYEEMCRALVNLGGYLVLCGTSNVLITPPPNLKCPPNVCVAFSSLGIPGCALSPGLCNVPLGIPGLGGPSVPDCVVCGLPWVDPSLPTGIYINVATANVLQVGGVAVRVAGAAAFAPVTAGMRLTPGSLIQLRAGSTISMSSPQGVLQTPAGGMPGKNVSALSAVDRALLSAVGAGQASRVEALLVQGAHVDARDPLGRTALMNAAARGDTATMAVLLKHGANPQTRSPQGWSAADVASVSHRNEALTALKRAGVLPRPASDLSRLKPDVEEPWYVFIGPSRRVLPKPVLARIPNPEVQRQWEQKALLSGGEAGRPMTDAEAKAALAKYMATGYAREHPRRP